MGVYLSKPKTKKFSEDGENGMLRYGLSSMQGWRATMEDAVNNLDCMSSQQSINLVKEQMIKNAVNFHCLLSSCTTHACYPMVCIRSNSSISFGQGKKLSIVCERVLDKCLAPSSGQEDCDNMTMILVHFKHPLKQKAELSSP